MPLDAVNPATHLCDHIGSCTYHDDTLDGARVLLWVLPLDGKSNLRLRLRFEHSAAQAIACMQVDPCMKDALEASAVPDERLQHLPFRKHGYLPHASRRSR